MEKTLDVSGFYFDLGRDSMGVVPPERRVGWKATTSALLADLVGTSIMALPSILAVYGWVPGLILITTANFIAFYGANVLIRTAFVYSNAITYMELARKLFPSKWRILVGCVMYGNFGGILCIYFLSITKSIANVFGLSQLNASYVSFAVCLLVGLTGRSYVSIGRYLSVVSMASAFVTFAAALWFMLTLRPGSSPSESSSAFAPSFNTSFWLPPWVSPAYQGRSQFAALSDGLTTSLFSYAGTSLFLEVMAEMEDPAQFSICLSIAYAARYGIFVLFASVCYGFYGDTVPGFVLDAVGLEGGQLRRMANGAFTIHVAVSYALYNQALSRAAHQLVSSETINNTAGFKWWAFLVSAAALVCWSITIIIPDFTDLISLISSLFTICAMLILPAFFRYSDAGNALSLSERTGLIVLCVVGVYVAIAGTYSSLAAILNKWLV